MPDGGDISHEQHSIPQRTLLAVPIMAPIDQLGPLHDYHCEDVHMDIKVWAYLRRLGEVGLGVADGPALP